MQPVNPVVVGALFWTAVLGCVVAQFFILRTAFRPLAPSDADSADPAVRSRMIPSSRRPMEIVWAILPVFLLAAAFYLAWQAMQPMSATALVSRLT